MVLVIIFVAAVVLLAKSGAPAAALPPPPIINPGPTEAQSGIAGSVAVGNALATAAQAIPVVGGAISSVINALDAAHVARAKAAINENVAVDNFIPGFDNAIAAIVNAYNNGAASAGQAIQMLDQQWHYYWQEVGPVIQAGRNGCGSGSNIDYSPMHPPTGSVAQHCSGSWGAACCIGAEVIGSSIGRLQLTIAGVDKNGGSATCGISPVVAGKYSNFSRAAYRVIVSKP